MYKYKNKKCEVLNVVDDVALIKIIKTGKLMLVNINDVH